MNKIKYSILFILLILGLGFIQGQNPFVTTYMNPIIPGDHPDPTLTKVGNDFYTSGSSFSPTPVIYHSTDLVHWEAISQPVSAGWSLYGQGITDGIWGGQLVYYGNRYWDFFGHWGTMYFVTANKAEGPWNTPTAMICPSSVPGLGMDNSIFIDEDGTWYLLVKNGQVNNWILQLGTNGQPSGKILDLRWINPAPSYPFSWAEGPVMWKYKGYYYYSFAINAAGGQKVFRSKELTADQASWINLGDLFNEADPKKAQSLFRGPNHCSQVVMLDDSTSWVIFQSYLTANNEWEGAGRQGLLSQVFYDTLGKPTANYPINEKRTAPDLSSGGIPWMVPHSDFFDSSILNQEWSLLGHSPVVPYSLAARPGWLRLSPKTNQQSIVIKTDAEHNYSLITRLDFNPKVKTDEAGIRIMTGSQTLYAKLFSSVNASGNKIIVFSFDTTRYETANEVGNVLWLRLVRENHTLTASFSSDGYSWKAAGNSINVKSMDVQQPGPNSWTGNRQGLYVLGSPADFDLYIYRDAYTSIRADCPANQYGTIPGPGILGQIHNNDWALYAGVEFRNDTSMNIPFAFEAIASTTINTGVIEIWLDSIQTGVKIGECNISSTGSFFTFKAFRTNILSVSGRHDVYLKFRSVDTKALFLLESFRFISPVEIQTAVKEYVSKDQILIYPNPARDIFTVSTGSNKLKRIEIFDTIGKLVQSNDCDKQDIFNHSFRTNLSAGIYILNLVEENSTASQKLIIEK
jgi:xylan 1,4-beta-xylosidase